MNSITTRWTPQLLSILRIVTAFLFVEHGMQKWLDFPAPAQSPTHLMSMVGISGILELVGGLLLLMGLFTRPMAFVLSGFMAFAYFIAHAPQGFWPLLNHGELAVMYCFVFLYMSAAGGGPWSVDAWLRDRKPAEAGFAHRRHAHESPN
ncbi:MAG: DoxX family protein [Ramlibacter sp.]|nr:DoxX family protein [Ramlibacter sp.]